LIGQTLDVACCERWTNIEISCKYLLSSLCILHVIYKTNLKKVNCQNKVYKFQTLLSDWKLKLASQCRTSNNFYKNKENFKNTIEHFLLVSHSNHFWLTRLIIFFEQQSLLANQVFFAKQPLLAKIKNPSE